MRVAGRRVLRGRRDLRPEGRQGALVRSLDGPPRLLKRWAPTWEFQALLKARPMAGDSELGQAYVRGASAPWCGRPPTGDDFVVDVQAMRRRVEDHVRPSHGDRELKLGRGGLRDVEFAVQLLQLVHGRATRRCARRPLWTRWPCSARAGTSAAPTGANLAASYRFLRLLEHRLQLQRLRRTHLLPADYDTDACVGSPARPAAGRRAQRPGRRAAGRSRGATPAGSAGCTRSSSTGRCSRPSPRVDRRRCGCRRRPPPPG